MSELKLPRLLAAAKEFNVGQDTIIDFLVGKGFNKDELKPTAKLGEDMYLSLQREFQGDKQAKNKADLVEIPKGVQQEGRKRRDEEEITFTKETTKNLQPALPLSCCGCRSQHQHQLQTQHHTCAEALLRNQHTTAPAPAWLHHRHRNGRKTCSCTSRRSCYTKDRHPLKNHQQLPK